MAKIYKIPRFKSAKTTPSSNGIKAQEVRANKKVSTGAAKKMTVFALLGKTGSFSNTTPGGVIEAMDGDPYTFFGTSGSAEATYTFPGSGIPFTKLEIAGSNYSGILVKVNGVTFTNWGTTYLNAPYHNVTSVGSPLTSITVKGNGSGQTSTISAIRINDTVMIAPDFGNGVPGSADECSASNFSPFDTDIIHEGPSQYATLNPKAHTGVTLSNGALTNTGGNDIPSNMGVKTGKFYAEVRIDTAYGSPNLKHLGIFATGTRSFRAESGNSHTINQLDGIMIRSDNAGPYTYTGRGGITSVAVVGTDTNVIYTLGDIVGIQLDMDNKFVKFYINGSLRVHYTFVLASTFDKMYFFGRNNGSGKTTWNFGQKPYRYTPPTEFLPLASHNLESSSILRPQRFFDTVLWTGNGSSPRAIGGLEFKPDFVWLKDRTGGNWHRLQNSVTGANKLMYSNSANQEATNETNGHVDAFTNDGFIVDDASGGAVNTNGSNFVAWCWKAGGDSNTFNVDGVGYATASAAGITDGSIALTGASINTKSGFSIITYTGNGTSGATIGHGLGAVPSVAIFKSRNLGTLGTAGAHWTVFHQNLTNGMNGGGSSRKVHLSLSQAEGSNSHGSVTASTSTTMTLTSGSGNDTDAHVNHTGGNYVCYCWTEIPGFSKFGSYKGNGNANGPYVDCGFRPSLVIYKRITNTDDWGMHDSARDPYNPVKRFLYPNLNNAEWSAGTQDYFEFYSNGFKLTQSSGMTNTDGETYIFMAWAEQPEVTPFGSQSNAR